MDKALEQQLLTSNDLALSRYPGEERRIKRGLVIALNELVTIKDGLIRVQSSQDMEVFYIITSKGCDCIDSTSGTATDGRCKHVWAGKLLAHAYQHAASATAKKKADQVDCQYNVLAKDAYKVHMSNDAQDNDQKETGAMKKQDTMSIVFTTAPKQIDKEGTVEISDSFLYNEKETMRKVSIPTKKLSTQEKAYNKGSIYFTFVATEEKVKTFMDKGIVTMKKSIAPAPEPVVDPEVVAEVGPVAGVTPEPEVVAPGTRKKRVSKKAAMPEPTPEPDAQAEPAIEVEVTPEPAPEVVAEVEPDPKAEAMEQVTEGLENLIEALTGKPYAGPLPGTFAVVDVVKGTAPAGLPESTLTQHLSCNKAANDPAIPPRLAHHTTEAVGQLWKAIDALTARVAELEKSLAAYQSTPRVAGTEEGSSSRIVVREPAAPKATTTRAPRAPKATDEATVELNARIIARYAEGNATGKLTQQQLADEFGMTRTKISFVLWNHAKAQQA